MGRKFATGLPTNPETIISDASNGFLVTSAGSATLTRLNASGSVVQRFTLATEDRGVDWVALKGDGCTLLYTSEGSSILRYNICTGTQLSAFSTGLPGSYAFQLRLLPDGGVLVANSEGVVRLDSAGNVVRTYTANGEVQLFAVALDRDGSSFWAQDYNSGDVLHFDLASGAVLSSFNDGAPGANTAGLTIAAQ